MPKDQKTRPSHAEALYPSAGTAPEPKEKASHKQAWQDHMAAKAGIRRIDPKSDRDRGPVSPLGGQAVRQPVKRSK
jgi:hypothetical protein